MVNFNRPAALAAAALGLPLLVGGAFAVLALARAPLESATPDRPILTTVGAAERNEEHPVTITLRPARNIPVRLHASGLITGLSLSPGDQPKMGDTLLHIDGLPIVAYVAPSPLHRDISAGQSGPDVRGVARLLTALGHLPANTTPTAAQLGDAIAEFNSSIGRPGTRLARSSVVWIPEGSGAVTTVTANIGDTVRPQAELYPARVGTDRVDIATKADDEERTLRIGETQANVPAKATSITASDAVAARIGVGCHWHRVHRVWGQAGGHHPR